MLVFLYAPRPHTSTLFPYTTLFRSLGRQGARSAEEDRSQNAFHERVPEGVGVGAGGAGRGVGGISGRSRGRVACGGGDGGLDRKSTRLNSSHRCISYAVFCLKKKIK